MSPTINSIKIPCLFWTDDSVLISTTKKGLQNEFNVVTDYCPDWKLTLNAGKAKTTGKAAGRLHKLSTFNYISIKKLLETFNSLVKPILLFS